MRPAWSWLVPKARNRQQDTDCDCPGKGEAGKTGSEAQGPHMETAAGGQIQLPGLPLL